mgnify:FL=1
MDLTTFEGIARAGDVVSGVGVSIGTLVVSYNESSGLLTVNIPLNIASGALLSFSGAVSRSNYLAVFGTVNPPNQRNYAGFVLKENKYVANLVNNSTAAPGEIIFGDSISGIKGFYSVVKMSTDGTTDLGGEKTLFAVESNYIINNGY